MPLTPAQRAKFQAIRSGATVSEASNRPGLGGQFLRAAGHRGQELINLLPGEQFESSMLELPEAQTFGEKAAQFVGGLAPDLALGVATAPIALGVRGAILGNAAASFGKKVAATFAGELAQSAALSPIEFATRKPGEALGVTALSALAGTGIGALGLKLAGRRAASLVGEAVEKTAKATPAELEATKRLAEGHTLTAAALRAKTVEDLTRQGISPAQANRLFKDPEMAERFAQGLEKQGRPDLAQKLRSMTPERVQSEVEKQAADWRNSLRESVAKLGKPGCQ